MQPYNRIFSPFGRLLVLGLLAASSPLFAGYREPPNGVPDYAWVRSNFFEALSKAAQNPNDNQAAAEAREAVSELRNWRMQYPGINCRRIKDADDDLLYVAERMVEGNFLSVKRDPEMMAALGRFRNKCPEENEKANLFISEIINALRPLISKRKEDKEAARLAQEQEQEQERKRPQPAVEQRNQAEQQVRQRDASEAKARRDAQEIQQSKAAADIGRTRAEVVQAIEKAIVILRKLETFPPGSTCFGWAYGTRRGIDNAIKGLQQIDEETARLKMQSKEVAANMAKAYPRKYAIYYYDLGIVTPDPKRVSNGCK